MLRVIFEMSFGFSIGDFIQVIEVTQKIVSKCKAATLEFRDLSRDVVSMQIVLDAVQRYWEQQKLNGRDLLDREKENLNELTQNCRDVLNDIEALLQKHAGLEAGTGLLNRIKWLRAGDLGPLRMRLIASTMYLSEFNRNVVAFNTSDVHLGSQAIVLNALNVVNYRYQIGRRSVPAFSQATAADLEHDTTWKGIKEDLEKEGVDPTAIAIEKPFIKKWIDDVILAEDTAHNDDNAADDESIYSGHPPPTSEGDQEQRSSYTESALTSPWNPRQPTRVETDRTLVDKSPTLNHANLTLSRTRDTRTSISSQGRRRSSDQKPRNQQIQANLDSLFRMNSGASKDLVDGLIEHVFAQLDTTGRGIFPDQLETALIPVIISAKPAVAQKALDVIETETVAGSRIDHDLFASILSQILEHTESPGKTPDSVKPIDDTSASRDALHMANKVAYHWLLAHASVNYVGSLLPYGWEAETVGVETKFYSYIPHNITCHKTRLPQLPVSIAGTFKNMLLLSKRCRCELDNLQELWDKNDELDKQYLQGFLELIEDVREAGQKFEVFSSRRGASPAIILDDLLGQISILDIADVAALGQMGSSPAKEVRELQHHAFQCMQSMIMFLVELAEAESRKAIRNFDEQQSTRTKANCFELQYITKPPSPGQSRITMEDHASQILTDAKKWWEGASNTIKACRNFAESHPQLSIRAEEALRGSKRLYLQSKRCKHLAVPRPLDLPEDKFLVLRLDHAEDFPKGNKLFRAGPPDIEAMVFIDNVKLTRRGAPAARTQTTLGKDIYRWNDAEPYHVSISEHCTLFVHIHNMKRSDRGDQGFMGLVNIDVSKLPTGLDCNPITMPLSNSFLKPGVHPGNITLRVHWCPLSQFVRMHQSSLSATWARKDTADDRFYFEDLRRDEKTAGSRTAIFDRWSDRLLGQGAIC